VNIFFIIGCRSELRRWCYLSVIWIKTYSRAFELNIFVYKQHPYDIELDTRWNLKWNFHRCKGRWEMNYWNDVRYQHQILKVFDERKCSIKIFKKTSNSFKFFNIFNSLKSFLKVDTIKNILTRCNLTFMLNAFERITPK
jgi:hypothetical protein